MEEFKPLREALLKAHFNSTKVQFGVDDTFKDDFDPDNFNSTKVQFGVQKELIKGFIPIISIPLRYNLEFAFCVRTSVSRVNFNSTKVQFGDSQIESIDLQNFISIPLRYNLEQAYKFDKEPTLKFQFH